MTSSVASDAEARRLRTVIAAIVRRFQLAARADLACCGMTVSQAATLESLDRQGGMTLGELGRELGIAPSTVTRNIDRLVERGLVRRERSPGDRRSSRAVLTPDGRVAAAAIDRVEQQFATDILERLQRSESTDVVETLERLMVAVQSATERCCAGAFDDLADTYCSIGRNTP
jgi:DNA-binding MarR family transcriptional regulator